jgi:ribosome-binding factor A
VQYVGFSFVCKRKKTGRRNDKIASQIRECFSLALSKGDFPILLNHENESKLPTLVTITYIDLSPDLRNAVIFFTPLCGMKKEETKRFFELQVHYFKNAIAKRMNLRFVPNLSFKLDESFDYSAKIEKLLKEKCQKDSNTF